MLTTFFCNKKHNHSSTRASKKKYIANVQLSDSEYITV